MALTRLARRMWREVDLRLLLKFGYTFGWQGLRAVNRFKRRAARGQPTVPPFMFISLTNACNLDCRGCWVTGGKSTVQLPRQTLHRIIAAWRQEGCRFFGLLGGEPLLYKGLLDAVADYPDCYFQVFTNGTLLDDDTAARMRQLGNVTPLISVEGDADVSDDRRGGDRVYQRSMAGIDACRRHGLVTGVATSVCRSNQAYVQSDAFLQTLVDHGVHYLWYYIYRPAGPRPTPELALDADGITDLRRFLVDARLRWPLMIVDAYWDAAGRGLCPAAMGISHHVNPQGMVEPCPPIQFARDSLADADDPVACLAESKFLERFRALAARTTRGCILLENPRGLLEFVRHENASDTSGRDTAHAELEARRALPGHDQPDAAVPERSRLYRFLKKNWFFGFGAYG